MANRPTDASTEAPRVTTAIVPLPDSDERLRDRQLALIVELLRRAYERRERASSGGLRLS
jgi:hypothetical protein